jgi:hypothetical protein
MLSATLALVGAFAGNALLRWAAAVASVVTALAFLLAIRGLEGYYAYSVYYSNRAFVSLFVAAFVALLLGVWWFRPQWLRERSIPVTAALVLAPFTAAVASDAIGTYRWNQYVVAFCSVLERDVDPQARLAELRNSGARTAWGWNHPSLSVLLRDRGSQAVVANEAGAYSWEPFPVERAPSLPHKGFCQSPVLGPERLDSFAVPISFVAGRPPNYVAEIRGLSRPEGWATWTEGDRLEIRFARRLPSSFKVIVEVAAAFGENATTPVKVSAGSQVVSFVAGSVPREVHLGFDGVEGADMLVFEIPAASSPAAVGLSNDTRRLGIALKSLRVVPR